LRLQNIRRPAILIDSRANSALHCSLGTTRHKTGVSRSLGHKDPPKEYQFKPGNCANPLGAKAHNVIKRQFRKLTQEQLEEVMTLILSTDPADLQAQAAKNPSVLKLWIANAASVGLKKGDTAPLVMMLDRILGKPKERVEITNKPSDMTDEELRAEIKRLEQITQKNETP
jgi:hypothetical protein